MIRKKTAEQVNKVKENTFQEWFTWCWPLHMQSFPQIIFNTFTVHGLRNVPTLLHILEYLHDKGTTWQMQYGKNWQTSVMLNTTDCLESNLFLHTYIFPCGT